MDALFENTSPTWEVAAVGLFNKLLGGDDATPDRGDMSGSQRPDVASVQPVPHEDYRIFPLAKQLNNGNWVVEVVLEDPSAGEGRRYDLAGPMREYASEEEARQAGVDFAINRVGMME